MISVQKKNFSIEKEIKRLNSRHKNIGAISSFIGIVRNKRQGEDLLSMTLEHYPQMANKMLSEIEAIALKNWDLIDTLIIHRYGELIPGDQIVLVITVSKHRTEAIKACHFLIDWLKTKGPFWKYEKTKDKGYWVEESKLDIMQEKKWEKILQS